VHVMQDGLADGTQQQSRRCAMLKPHGNDRFGDHPHAGVVVAGVPAHVMVA